MKTDDAAAAPWLPWLRGWESPREWLPRMPAWAVEAALCSIAVLAAVYRIDGDLRLPGDRPPDAIAYGLGVGMAMALLARRHWPAAVLALITLGWLAYHIRGYPGGAPAVAVWIALYSVAVSARRQVGLTVAAALIIIDALGRTAEPGVRLFDAVLDSSTVVFVAALAVGDAVRSRRAWHDEAEARAAMQAVQTEQTARQRIREERVRIARDLHDVSAHTLAVITVQTDVAAELLAASPQRAAAAIQTVQVAGREAMNELRAVIGVLRERPSPVDSVNDAWAPNPSPGLARINDLVAGYESSTMDITVQHTGRERTWPMAVETTAYRIVQESLANARRHGGASQVTVTIGHEGSSLAIEIRDNGTGSAPAGAGYGVRGMAERAASLNGSFSSGPDESGGFVVRALLPDPAWSPSPSGAS